MLLIPFVESNLFLLLYSAHCSHLLILRQDIRYWSHRRDPRRINPGMTPSIVLLDMFKLRRTLESFFIPIQFPQPPMQRRVAGPNIPYITLKLLDVYRIETHYSYIQSHICFCDLLTIVVRAGGSSEVVFGAIQRFEKVVDGRLISFLFRGNAAFVDAIVDVAVSPFVCLLDLGPQVLWQKIDGCVLLGEKIIEFCVQHADDLAGFVVDNLMGLGVVKDWNREPARVFRVDGEVKLTYECVRGVNRIRANVLAGKCLVFRDEAPT